MTMASRVTGLAREAAMSRLFGMSAFTDAFFFAFQLPNLFRRLFGEGALSAAFLPEYARLDRDDPASAQALSAMVFGRFAVGMTVLAGAGIVLLLAVEGLLDRQDAELVQELMAIMLPYMPMVCLVALVGAVLQVRGVFAPTAAAPIILNLGMVAGAFAGARLHGVDGPSAFRSIAWAVLIAGILQVAWSAWALRRAGAKLPGAVEQSATVDEESGGFAGVAYLAQHGHLNPTRQQHVIITEPHGPDRICLGHRGVWWFDVVMKGHIAHGSMPFNGINAVDRMTTFLSAVTERLRPKLAARVTEMPCEPKGARHATLNINSIFAGQPIDQRQSPCVPDRCTVIFDRRFLPEEDLAEVQREFKDLLAELGLPHEMRDRMIVHPTFTPSDSPVSSAVAGAIQQVCHKPATFMASPGTYDQKHFVRIAKVTDCISYGPGVLEMAHQPDEYVSLDDLNTSAKVMALATLRLMGIDTGTA